MTATTTDVRTIPTIGHDEAMTLAATEHERFLTVVRALTGDDWDRPTDCTLWDVRAMVGHNLGNIEAAASVRELVGQQVKALRRSRREGTTLVDGMTAVQVEERAGLSTDELVARLVLVMPKAVAGRRRTPALLRDRARFDMGEGRGGRSAT